MQILWLYFIIIFYISAAWCETLCPKEEVDINGTKIVWPEKKPDDDDNFYAISRPGCFDHSNEIILRRCLQKSWIPKDPPTCVFPRKNRFCPEDLIEVPVKNRFICLKVSDPQPWDEKFCYGSDKTLFDLNTRERKAVLNYLGYVYNISRFWLPARRYVGEGSYDPIVWWLPGKEWGELVRERYNEASREKCVSVQVNNYNLWVNLVMTNCYDALRSVCIFKKDLVVPSACPKAHAAMSYDPTVCYGITKIDDFFEFNYLPFLHTDNIFGLIFDYLDLKKQKCYAKLVHDFAPSIVLDPAKMELSLARSADCRLNDEILEPDKTIQMFLIFNAAHDTLVLTVYNRKHIWREDKKDYGIKCFTNADYEMIHVVKIKDLIWEDDTQSKSLFELKLYGDGPGYYWCEAHSIFDFELIEAPKIVATKKRKGHPFAFFFDIPCTIEDCFDINDNMKHYGKRVEKILNNIKEEKKNRRQFKPIVIHNVRVMNIEDIMPDDKMRFLCHATVSLKKSSVDNSSEEDSDEDDDELEENGIRHDTAVRSKLRDMLEDMLSQYKYGFSQKVNSTEYCFPESFSPQSANQWRAAKIGMSSTTYDLCLLPNGLPVARKCIGNFLYGAVWEPANKNLVCIKSVQEDIITTDLFQIERSNIAKYNPTKVINDLKEIVNKTRKIIPADLFYIGRIMQTIANNIILSERQNQTTPDVQGTFKALNNSQDIVNIYNYLMEVDPAIIKLSTTLNSTNILLEAFETIIDEISIQGVKEDGPSSSYERPGNTIIRNGTTNGVKYEISPKLMVFVIDPEVANISGVAVLSNDTHNSDFTNVDFKLLQSNQSKSELLLEEDLEIAAFAPQSLLDRLDEIIIVASENGTVFEIEKPPVKIIIKIYYNDRLFQENIDITNKKVYGKIISISIPGYDRDLPELLPLFVRTGYSESENDTISSCKYWNYSTWADDGVEFIEQSPVHENLTLFGCSHLTPFAYLIGGTYNLSVSADVVVITKIHEEALDIITLLGCSLSLIGTIGIVITAITFQTWREKPSSKVLLQLSAAIALQMILFCFVNTDVLTTHLIANHIFSSCIALGVLLHYSVLVQFSWMLIVAFLQYKRYVQVIGKSRPTRFFLKAFLLGWGLPLVPVLLVVLINREAYIPVDNPDNSKICYPIGQALYLGVILPIGLIISANLIIFILVIYHIVRGPDGMGRQTERRLAVAQLRISILLFFLLGFTWIFGLLAAMKAGLMFSYLFCLTATLQGFVLFIYFVVLDPITRKLWSNFIRKLFCNKDKK